MAWTFADAAQTMVTDGITTVPLNQPTGLSAMAGALVAANAVLPYVAPPQVDAPLAYTAEQLTELLVTAKLIPAAQARIVPSPVKAEKDSTNA